MSEQPRIAHNSSGTLTWRVGSGGFNLSLDNGDLVCRDAVLVWKGRDQIRDITWHADGSITMGADKSRKAAP